MTKVKMCKYCGQPDEAHVLPGSHPYPVGMRRYSGGRKHKTVKCRYCKNEATDRQSNRNVCGVHASEIVLRQRRATLTAR